MTLREFHQFLSGIDWYYQMSDVYSVWSENNDKVSKARIIARTSFAHADMLLAFEHGGNTDLARFETAT